MMTFEQFQATKTECADLGVTLKDAGFDREGKATARGFLYCETLFIEEVLPDWPEKARAAGRWYLLLGRDEWISDDLESLERQLFEFACGEGYCDD